MKAEGVNALFGLFIALLSGVPPLDVDGSFGIFYNVLHPLSVLLRVL